MKIKWYGTASLLIEGGGSSVLIDPFLKKYNPKLPPFPVEEGAGADAVLITHPHFDHFCDIGSILEAGAKKVYVSENGIAHARETGVPTDRMIPLSAGETLQIGALTVKTYQSRHCKFDLWTVLSVVLNPATYFRFRDGVEILKATGKYKIGEDIYALEISCEGKRVFVLGSAGMDGQTDYPKGADLLVFPYQGRTRMHRYLGDFLRVFEPKAVMIDHFDNSFPPLTHTVNVKKFLPSVKKILPSAKAFVPREGVFYEI